MRAQAHTLEAFVAALILLSSIVFALQVTAVTPLTASTSSQHIENQQGAVAKSLLATADENGTLERTILYVNATSGRFHGASDRGRYPLGGPPTAFGRALNRTFLDRGIAANLYVHWIAASGQRRSQQVVYTGAPSDNAVSASHTVTLTDDDRLHEPGPGGKALGTGPTLRSVRSTDGESFYAPDASDGVLYNVVDVEVIVWRM